MSQKQNAFPTDWTIDTTPPAACPQTDAKSEDNKRPSAWAPGRPVGPNVRAARPGPAWRSGVKRGLSGQILGRPTKFP